MILPHHKKAVTEQRGAKNMEEIKRPDHCRIGFKKFPDEPLKRITSHKNIEALPLEKS
jgi:hypothetical protein